MELLNASQVGALLGRSSTCRYAPGFPAPAVLSKGPRPALYDRASVLAWAVDKQFVSGPKSAPKPTTVAASLIPLPTEAQRVRSLIRDVTDGPGKRPPPCALWKAALDGERYADASPAQLAAENRRPSNRRFVGREWARPVTLDL